MKILVTGAAGLIGTALSNKLNQTGHKVLRLWRGKHPSGEPHWNLKTGTVELGKMNGVDAVVHLAGENIASSRWTISKKKQIRDSRICGTRLLVDALINNAHKPKVLVSASAIGFYGNRTNAPLTEDSPEGSGFLAEVCRSGEEAAQRATKSGIRVVHARMGIVLSQHGGALKKMLGPFKTGAGGVLGNGKHMMSWVTITDIVSMLIFSINCSSLTGAVNFVAPKAVSNHEFTKTLGRVLHRPTVFPMSPFVAKMLFGEMANALLFSNTNVVPQKLHETGFKFQHTSIEKGLRAELK